MLAEAVNKNFHPYYKLKNNIHGFSTHTKKKRIQPPASPHFQSGASIFFISIPRKTGSSFFFPFCNTFIFQYFIRTALFNVSRKPTDTGTTLLMTSVPKRIATGHISGPDINGCTLRTAQLLLKFCDVDHARIRHIVSSACCFLLKIIFFPSA